MSFPISPISGEETMAKKSVNLDELLGGMSVEQLDEVVQRAQAQKRKAAAEARKVGFVEIEEVAKKHGLTKGDLRAHYGGGGPKRQGAVKYRHPETGEGWKGVGRKPNWVVNFESGGGDLEKLRVD